jgi:hypothetical protein
MMRSIETITGRPELRNSSANSNAKQSPPGEFRNRSVSEKPTAFETPRESGGHPAKQYASFIFEMKATLPRPPILQDDDLTYVRPSSMFKSCAAFRDSEPVIARVLLSILST